MKKSLLFAVAAMSMVASANAQIISRVKKKKNAKMANVAKSQVFDLSNVCVTADNSRITGAGEGHL